MTWTKLDDGIFDHPKMLRAGEDAANLYVRALVYCNKHLTDGRVYPEVLTTLTRRRDVRALAQRLVDVGAWEIHDGAGWIVHDFHAHNPTAEEVNARRADIARKRAEAGKRGGIASGRARSNEANDKQAGSKGEATPKQPDEANTKPRPVPSRPVLLREDNRDVISPPSTPPTSSGASAPLLLVSDEPKATVADEVRSIFAHWQTATKRPGAKLDPKRESVIRAALKRHPADDLRRAIDGYAVSPWHQGENDRGRRYDGLELILRDAAHVEAGVDLAGAHGPDKADSEDLWAKGLRELEELTQRRRAELQRGTHE